MTLSHDPLWPRAGGWPAPGTDADGWDAVLLGVPAWRTSLSPTGAHATPAAVREALRRFSPTLLGPPPVDLAES
ncbi:MAG: formimidoylglutamase, partial [Microbacterium sp.]